MEKFGTAITVQSKPTTKPMPIMAERTSRLENPNDHVRIVSLEECKEAAKCLADAFTDDDVAKYFIHTESAGFRGWNSETWKLHQSICEYLVYAHCLKGLVTTAGPNYDSIALWMPPGKTMDDWFTMFKSGMWRLRYQLSTEGCYRFFKEFLPLLGETKAAALGADDENSWYLVYLGTRPGSQGKGYAKALIEMVTKQADAEGLKCYLESSHQRNFEYYKRRGFKPDPKTPKIFLKRDHSRPPIELDIMVREPDPSKLESHSVRAKDIEKRDTASQMAQLNAIANSTR